MNLDAATEAARAVLDELRLLMADEGAQRADMAVLKWYADNTVSWRRGDEDGASVVRMAGAGDRRSHEILKEQAALYLRRGQALPDQLAEVAPRLISGDRPRWPSRDPAINHWRDLCITAAVQRVVDCGFHATRGRDKHDDPDARPSACSIVAPLVRLSERRVEDIWTAHLKEADPIGAARAVIALIP